MARLKFIGIIKEADINKYQKCSVDNKLNPISSDKDNIQLKAIPICIVLIVLCNILLFIKVFSSTIREYRKVCVNFKLLMISNINIKKFIYVFD